MATTCKLIAKNVLGSSTSSVTFGSIPATFDDLWLMATARSDRSASDGDTIKARFNGAANDANLSTRGLYAYTTPQSQSLSEARIGLACSTGHTSNTFASTEVYIPNYAGSTNKSMSSFATTEDNTTTNSLIAVYASLWQDTSAITQITMFPGYGTNFVTGSSFYLFGITKA